MLVWDPLAGVKINSKHVKMGNIQFRQETSDPPKWVIEVGQSSIQIDREPWEINREGKGEGGAW